MGIYSQAAFTEDKCLIFSTVHLLYSMTCCTVEFESGVDWLINTKEMSYYGVMHCTFE